MAKKTKDKNTNSRALNLAGASTSDIIAAVEKTFGAGSIMSMNGESLNVDFIPTGIPALDFVLGGGWPKGRIIEIFGPESCLDSQTYIPYEVWSSDLTIRRNHKGSSIQRLYERFKGVEDGGPKQGKHLQEQDSIYYVKSVNDEGFIVRNEVLDVVKTGEKECFELVSNNGFKIVATADHKFMSPIGFKRLGDLKVKDNIFIHNNTRSKGREKYGNRPTVMVKYHPYLPTKIIDGKYLYYRGMVSRMAVEASLNELDYIEYIEKLNNSPKEEILKMNFLPDNIHVHHEDEDYTNNEISNLMLIDPSEHGKLHAKDRLKNLSFIAVEDEIVSINPVGIRSTYDIKCHYPNNNFIADSFVVHNSGKTSITFIAIAASQFYSAMKSEEKANAMIDAEHSCDPSWAQKLGVNLDSMLLSQPDCGEEGLEIVDQLVKTGKVTLIVIDSISALTPKAEIEAEMGTQFIGLQARMMSQALRKLTANIGNSNSVVIFVNQIRNKIGILFGCLHDNTLVNFTDGRSIPIGQVVKDKIQGNVWAYDKISDSIVPSPIIDWHENGKVETYEDFIHIQTVSIDGHGRFGITVTPDHEVLVSGNKWKKAKDIDYSDKLISKYTSRVNGSYGDFIWGCLIGDSHLSLGRMTACMKLQDNENSEYVQWKLDKLSKITPFSEKRTNKGYRYNSEYTYEFAKIKKELRKRNPICMLKEHYSDMSLAIWFMDDGHYDHQGNHNQSSISVKRFKNNKDILKSICEHIYNSTGIEAGFRILDGTITFDKRNTALLFERIAKFVPPCMMYKIDTSFYNRYIDFELENEEKLLTEEVEIKEIRYASPRQMRWKNKYDITISKYHSYMVGGTNNGVVVHNSPETVSGGIALRFYASQRVDVRRKIEDSNKDGDIITGNNVSAKVVKNKVAPPFRKVEEEGIVINFGKGFDILKSLIWTANQCMEIRAGSWYKIDGESFQGDAKLKEILSSKPDKLRWILNSIKEKFPKFNTEFYDQFIPWYLERGEENE